MKVLVLERAEVVEEEVDSTEATIEKKEIPEGEDELSSDKRRRLGVEDD